MSCKFSWSANTVVVGLIANNFEVDILVKCGLGNDPLSDWSNFDLIRLDFLPCNTRLTILVQVISSDWSIASHQMHWAFDHRADFDALHWESTMRRRPTVFYCRRRSGLARWDDNWQLMIDRWDTDTGFSKEIICIVLNVTSWHIWTRKANLHTCLKRKMCLTCQDEMAMTVDSVSLSSSIQFKGHWTDSHHLKSSRSSTLEQQLMPSQIQCHLMLETIASRIQVLLLSSYRDVREVGRRKVVLANGPLDAHT